MESEDVQKSDEINLCNLGLTATIAVFQHDLIDLLGGNIPIEAEYKASKEVQIQLAKAVALKTIVVVSPLPKKPAERLKPQDQDQEQDHDLDLKQS
jgi:hypothetical protein